MRNYFGFKSDAGPEFEVERFTYNFEKENTELEFNIADFPLAVLKALQSGLESVAIRLAVAFGYRDQNLLTNLVFFFRHPERKGRKLEQNEPDFNTLSQEWLQIRDYLVRPVLSSASTISAQLRSPSSEDASNRWVLPPDVRASGEAQFIRYDSPPPWDNGQNCTNTFTRGAADLRDYIRSTFRGVSSIGGYNCRQNTANRAQTSVHGTGRALDIMIPPVNRRANSTVGDPIANWLVQNAEAIGIQYIIWNRTRWSGSRRGRKDGDYGGPSPHIDHIHVELNRDAAARSTPWFLSRTHKTGSSQPELMVRPLQQETTSQIQKEIDPETSDYVEWLQRSLNQILGLRLSEDGVLGSATRSAIRSFQQKHGLAVDGIAGPQTEAAIRAALGMSAAANKCQVLDNFEFDQDVIRPIHQSKLIEIAKHVVVSQGTSQPIGAIRLIGHTDPVGSAAYNLTLGRRRADQVRARLGNLIDQLQRGLATKIAFTVGTRGETQPISSDPVRNRRVEICLEIKPKPIGPAKPGGQDTNYKRWFTTGGTPAMQPIRLGNQASWLVGGLATFKAMVNAMRTATSQEHFIYLINWHVTDSFELIPGDRNSTVHALLSRADQNGVQVRALLSDHHGNSNGTAASHINALANGAAILDDRIVSRSSFISVGSHHQKILIVNGREGLIAFCGGVDLNPDRIRASSSSGGSGSGSGSGGGGGAPLHDVHCQIRGPAAYDALRIFVERWQDHPAHSTHDRAKGKLLGLSERVPGSSGKHYIQIARTYGNGRHRSGVSGGYRFAPNGEKTALRMILHAIDQARRFIYLEDQYLVSMEMSAALVRTMPRIQHLTIVIPHTNLLSSTECPQDFKRRRSAFIAPLIAAGGSKVRIFHLHPPGSPNTYVHSKTWVIDDEFAIIGSANCNRRSYTHDSEVTAGIYDPERLFAKQLRVALWAKHLNMNTSAGRAALADGVAGARFWLSLPAGAHVAPFNHLASVSTSNAPRCRLASWDTHIDPDGS